jgi:hypothetical protein
VKRKKKPAGFAQPDATVWIDRGYQPCYIGFCPSERAWKIMMKRLGQPHEPYPRTDANMTSVLDQRGKECLIVTIHARFDKHHGTGRANHVSTVALLAHECMHVWQYVLKHMGEVGRPSQELEAYFYQGVFQKIYEAYLNTRIRRTMPL